MKIAVSLLNLRPGTVGGAETYVRQLLAHLVAAGAGDSIIPVAFRESLSALDVSGLAPAVVDRSDRRMVLARIGEAFSPWRDLGLERQFEAVGADVAFFPQQSVCPKAVRGPVVLTVVDVQHLFFPRNFGLFDRAFRAALYPRSLRRADRVIAISEFTKRTLVERCGIAPEKIVAIPLGVSPAPVEAAASCPPLPGRYLYYPAATFPHKNHETLFRTLTTLRRRGGFDLQLVLTGQRTSRLNRLRRLTRELGIDSAVHHLGFLPYAEVAQVYLGAEAVVFPSRFEGFGLPVVEAVRFGRKVICSRLEVFDEIGVPKRWQIDFAQPDALLAALAMEGPTVLEKPLWTWAEVARATLDVLHATARRAG